MVAKDFQLGMAFSLLRLNLSLLDFKGQNLKLICNQEMILLNLGLLGKPYVVSPHEQLLPFNQPTNQAINQSTIVL